MFRLFKKKTKARKKLDDMKDALENAIITCRHFDDNYNGTNTIIIDNASSITYNLVQLSYKVGIIGDILSKEEDMDDERYRLY